MAQSEVLTEEIRTWVERTVRGLVDRDEAVRVTQVQSSSAMAVVWEVRVDPSDFGKLLGRQGEHADALRSLLNAMSKKRGARLKYIVDLIDPRKANGTSSQSAG